jgi:hypothetical protein
LELDGYCPELGLAFEYQGAQHSEYVPFFHRNGIADYVAQRQRDAEKLERADERWITVIVVWHTVKNVEAFLDEALEELGYI